MTLVLHRGRVFANPLRIDQDLLDTLFLPYVGKRVLLHLACEDRFFSWKGRGTLRPSPLGASHPWRLHHDNGFDLVPFDQLVEQEIVLSVVPEPDITNEAGVDDLLQQARSLADLLTRVKQS